MMCKETLQELYSMWKVAIRERDEASERLQKSLAELSQLQKLANDILLSQEQKAPHYNNHFSSDSPSRFSLASPLDFPIGNSSPAISDAASYSSTTTNQMGFVDQHKEKDFETIVLEMIGGVLPKNGMPQNGKFVQAVIEAGPLVESLLITGPVPKWRNPPVQVSGKRPVLSNNYEHIGINWISGGGLELSSGMLNQSLPFKKERFSLMS